MLIGGGETAAQDRLVNAFPLELAPRPLGPRRVLGGVVLAVVVLLSIWLLVAAGLQQDQTSDARPRPLPEARSTIQTDLNASGLEAGPAPMPGPDITPVRGSLEPR